MDVSCPDASVFAELAAGGLSESQRFVLESHFDQCPLCKEVLGLVGAIHDGSQSADAATLNSIARNASAWRLREQFVMALAMAVGQCVWTVLSWWPLVRRNTSTSFVAGGPCVALYVDYLVVVGFWGLLLSVMTFVAMRARGANFLLALHALMNIPTVALTPLALVVLHYLRQQRRRVELQRGTF
jgi:uncharacterized protein YjiS (DUF1127 family)